MPHDHHHHGHQHGHSHGSGGEGGTGNFKLAFWLNLVFCAAEFAGGFYTGSLAINSNALHDLGDVASLGLAWYLERLSRRKRDKSYTYGYRRFSLLGAFINAMILIVGSVFILREALPRLFHPEHANASGMFVFALAGIAVNSIAIVRMRHGHSAHERAITLHLLGDVLGWVGVLLISIVLYFVPTTVATAPLLNRLDPALSVVVAVYILYNVAVNLYSNFQIFLQAMPEGLDVTALQNELLALPDVAGVHDLHAWTMDGAYHVLTLHLVVKQEVPISAYTGIKQQAQALIKSKGVEHATIEMESAEEGCKLADC